MTKIKAADVARIRSALLDKQKHLCPLCEGSMKGTKGKKPALDHDHTRGHIRDVLCLNCNGIEGKVYNLARRCGSGQELRWIKNLTAYWEKHQTSQHGLIHHTHKTPLEKKLIANTKARKKRAALKERHNAN